MEKYKGLSCMVNAKANAITLMKRKRNNYWRSKGWGVGYIVTGGGVHGFGFAMGLAGRQESTATMGLVFGPSCIPRRRLTSGFGFRPFSIVAGSLGPSVDLPEAGGSRFQVLLWEFLFRCWDLLFVVAAGCTVAL